jgi:hypothetical protein
MSDIVPRPRWSRVWPEKAVSLKGLRAGIGKSLSKDRKLLTGALRKLGISAGGKGKLLIGSRDDGPELERAWKKGRARLPGGKLGEEGYVLVSDRDGVAIVADGVGGAFYGVQTLGQLVRRGSVPKALVADVPVNAFRGMHISTGGTKSYAQIIGLLEGVLPQYKVNTLVLGIGYFYRFRSHPELKQENQFTRSQVKHIVKLSRERCIRVIPEMNCLGHQSWRTERIGALLRAYPEFNETPGKRNITYCYSWCPSDPRVYRVVFDLIDELVDVFEADAFHAGMDEVFELGECPRCRGKGVANLYAKAVNDIHRHVVGRRGTQMLMWGDRLIDGAKTPYNRMNGARNGTHPAIRMIPRDILICDWHYHTHRSYPSVQRFRRAGFDFVTCSYQKPRAVGAFMRYAARHGGKRCIGHLDTNWGEGKRGLECLLAGKVGESGPADAFRRGLDLAWRGAL